MAGTLTITVRGGRSLKVGVVFLTATAVTSAGVGAALGAAGHALPAELSLSVAGLIAALYAAAFVRYGRVPFLAWPPQLPSRWLDRERPVRSALRYGFAWGLTFSTPVRAGSLFALAFVVAALGDFIAGAVLFAVVGLVKAFPTALTPLRPPSEETAKRRPALVSAWQRPLVSTLDAVLLITLVAVAVRAGTVT